MTLRLSAPGTRTSLLNDKTVLWSEGDKVVINDVTYDVTISADDPGVATVENVTEADEYFAIYVYSWTDNDSPQYAKVKDGDSFYYLLELPDWQVCQKGTFASFVNPMAGYGKGTDMKFHNLGSVVKIGLTGNGETISDVTLVSNS